MLLRISLENTGKSPALQLPADQPTETEKAVLRIYKATNS